MHLNMSEAFTYDGDEKKCAVAQSILTNPYFLVAQGTIVGLNALGLLLMTLFIVLLYKNKRMRSLHINIRILFANLTGLIAFRTLWTLVRSASNIIVYIHAKVPCDHTFNFIYCMVEVGAGRLVYYSIVVNFGVITIERLAATVQYKKYERRTSAILNALGFLVIYLPSLYNMCIVSKWAIVLSPEEMRPLLYCSSSVIDSIVPVNGTVNMVINYALAAFVTFTLFAFIGLNVYNWHLRRMFMKHALPHTLSARFQVNENRRTTEFVIPIAFAFAILTMTTFLSVMFMERIIAPYADKLVAFAVFKEVASLWIPAFSVLFPIIAIFEGQKHFRILSDLRKKKVGLGDPTFANALPGFHNKGSDYFKQYHQQWDYFRQN